MGLAVTTKEAGTFLEQVRLSHSIQGIAHGRGGVGGERRKFPLDLDFGIMGGDEGCLEQKGGVEDCVLREDCGRIVCC